MSRPVSIQGTEDVIPSGYAGASNVTAGTGNYVPSNAYHDHTWSSNYARWQLSASSTSTVCYVYYTFDTSTVPSNATITSVTATVKAYRNNRVTQNTAGVQLYANTTAKGTAVAGTLGTSATTVNITNGGSWTRSELNNLRIRLYGVRSSTNNNSYLYLYGATVTINYTVSGTEYEVTVSNSSPVVTTDPTGTEYVYQGNNKDVFIYTDYLDEITVIDNGNNIKSQLVQIPSVITTSYIPTSSTNSGFTITDLNNAYSDAESSNYASLELAGGESGDFYLNFPVDIPSGAVIQSVTPKATFGFNRNNSSSGYTAECQMYSGSSYKGQTTSIVTSGSSDVEKTMYTLNSGTWTASELSNARLYLTATNNASSTHRFLYVYGASLEITYESDGLSYKYTISNISADHTITIADIPGTNYTVTASSSYSGATVSPSTQSVREGRDAVVEIRVNDIQEIVVKDNGTDVTSSVVQLPGGGYSYTIESIRAAHTITVTEASYYSITGSSTFSSASFTNLPKKIYTSGSNYTVIINSTGNQYSYKLFDNTVDVTDNIVRSGTVKCIPVEYVYGTSTPTNPNNALHDTSNTTYAEHRVISGAYWEYKIDTSNIPQNVTIVSISCKVKAYGTRTSNCGTVQLYSGTTAKGSTTNVPTSESVFEINNIGTWTREDLDNCILRINSTYTGSTAYYVNLYGAELIVEYSGNNYTIEDVREDHTLLLVEQDKYSVTASSDYASAGVGVSSNSVYKGDSFVITVNVSDIGLVSVSDNGTMITGLFSSSSPYTCTIYNVRESHEILVTEKIVYHITVTDIASNGNIVPTGNLTVEAGYDSLFKIITDDINSILLQDDDRLANSDLIYHESISGTNLFIPSGFDENNSNYAGIYNNYTADRGYKSISTSTNTYAAFSAITGASAESHIVYTIDCSSIPSGAIIDNISCSIRGRTSNNTYITSSYAQLYSGNTAKGGQATFTASVADQSISNCGTWTREELNDVKLYVFFTRGTTQTTTAAQFRFYGADFTVTYHVDAHYTYEIKLVSDDHNLILKDWPEKLIYVKKGNKFILPMKIFKKVSGSWVDYTDNPELIDTSKIYINRE